jgi:heptosyltransferase III
VTGDRPKGETGRGRRRILIYRLGSLGDTVVSLPCFHLVARAFPDAERRVLTNVPVSAKAAPLELVLGDSGLIHGIMRHPIGLRRPGDILALARAIRAYKPDCLIYMTEPHGPMAVWRNHAFFRLCGIPRIVGVPLGDLAAPRYLPARGRWEYEAERLALCLDELGDAELDNAASWDLHFTPAEESAAAATLRDWPGSNNYAGFSIGAKIDVKDWGDANWRAVLETTGAERPGLGLAIVGSADEAARSDALAAHWPGPVVNLCGKVSPRVSALVLRGARLFFGHDSGPMHLAAAVGTPTVPVFSARVKPGVWFPYGDVHRVHYHRTPCFDCHLDVCRDYDKTCIRLIRPEDVAGSIRALLGGEAGR